MERMARAQERIAIAVDKMAESYQELEYTVWWSHNSTVRFFVKISELSYWYFTSHVQSYDISHVQAYDISVIYVTALMCRRIEEEVVPTVGLLTL